MKFTTTQANTAQEKRVESSESFLVFNEIACYSIRHVKFCFFQSLFHWRMDRYDPWESCWREGRLLDSKLGKPSLRSMVWKRICKEETGVIKQEGCGRPFQPRWGWEQRHPEEPGGGQECVCLGKMRKGARWVSQCHGHKCREESRLVSRKREVCLGQEAWRVRYSEQHFGLKKSRALCCWECEWKPADNLDKVCPLKQVSVWVSTCWKTSMQQ